MQDNSIGHLVQNVPLLEQKSHNSLFRKESAAAHFIIVVLDDCDESNERGVVCQEKDRKSILKNEYDYKSSYPIDHQQDTSVAPNDIEHHHLADETS